MNDPWFLCQQPGESDLSVRRIFLGRNPPSTSTSVWFAFDFQL